MIKKYPYLSPVFFVSILSAFLLIWGTDYVPHSFYRAAFSGECDVDTATIKCVWLDTNYTPNVDHDSYDDVSSNELECTGYDSGGVTCACTTYVDNNNDFCIVDCDNPSWTVSEDTTIGAQYAVFYFDNHATKQIMYIFDMGRNVEKSQTEDHEVVIDNEGLFRVNHP